MGPLRRLLALLAFAAGIAGAAAHPMPNTLIEVGVSPRRLVFDLKIPLADVETVVFQTAGAAPEGDAPLPAFAILQRYFSEHLKVMGADGAFWPTGLLALDTLDIDDALSGPYAELHATVYAAPPPGADIRRFFLYYDAIMHQIVTHQAIVSIRRDWENGIYAGADTTGARALAVIRVEPVTGEVLPVVVQLEKGSTWKGFTATFWLGMRHIAEGYDHLLFLLLLLVVAPLPAAERRWNGFGGWQFGLWRLLRIVTAFTVGHSLTLAICSLGWLRFSGRWVEVAIAFSILISAVHALRPLFFNGKSGSPAPSGWSTAWLSAISWSNWISIAHSCFGACWVLISASRPCSC